MAYEFALNYENKKLKYNQVLILFIVGVKVKEIMSCWHNLF